MPPTNPRLPPITVFLAGILDTLEEDDDFALLPSPEAEARCAGVGVAGFARLLSFSLRVVRAMFSKMALVEEEEGVEKEDEEEEEGTLAAGRGNDNRLSLSIVSERAVEVEEDASDVFVPTRVLISARRARTPPPLIAALVSEV